MKLEDMIWDHGILKSCVRHYEKFFDTRKDAEEFVRTELHDYMVKYYQNMYLPELNRKIVYGG